MKKNNFLLFFILLILYPIYCHKCGTDLLSKTPASIKINVTENSKRQLSNTYTPLKIKVDYKYLQKQKEQNLLGEEKLNTLENIFSTVTDSFSSIISVDHLSISDIKSDIKRECEIEDFEEGIENVFMTNDILILPRIDSSLNKATLAAATPCLIADKRYNYKPLAGIVLINKNLDSIKNDFVHYMKNLLFHELTHVIGFHPFYFTVFNFLYTQKIDGITKSYIKSPKVLEKAKIHFGCDSIKGIQLENQGETGTQGSHWEMRYMLGDFMVGEDYSEVVISDITLAFLEDTGFYKVNYYTGGLFRYGKNQGCAFLNKKCLYNKGESTSFPNEFCTNSRQAFCGSSHIAKGDCYIVTYKNPLNDIYRYYQDKHKGGKTNVDYCPVSFIFETDSQYFYPQNCKYGKAEYSNYGEIIGDNSMCFESSLLLNNNKKSICYKMSCDKENKQIKINIGSTTVICPGNTTVLNNPSGLTGTINCPDYNMICTSDIWCNDMFDCISKKSIADENSYEYISNKDILYARDQINLKVNDKNAFIDDSLQKLQFNHLLLLLYFFLLFI